MWSQSLWSKLMVYALTFYGPTVKWRLERSHCACKTENKTPCRHFSLCDIRMYMALYLTCLYFTRLILSLFVPLTRTCPQNGSVRVLIPSLSHTTRTHTTHTSWSASTVQKPDEGRLKFYDMSEIHQDVWRPFRSSWLGHDRSRLYTARQTTQKFAKMSCAPQESGSNRTVHAQL